MLISKTLSPSSIRPLLASAALSLLTGFFAAGLFGAGAQAQCERPQVLLSVDKSSSMLASLPDGLTKWDATRMAIGDMVTGFEAEIDFGLQVFPMPNRCEPGEVVVPMGRNDAADIMSGLGSPPPSAGNWTPMSQTLDVAGMHAPLLDATRESTLVLLTDGWQWCSPYDGTTRFDVVDAVSRLTTQGVRVFIVGFGASVDALALNRAAVAAGTGRAGCNVRSSDPEAADNCYLSALDRVSLQAALRTIAGVAAAESCDGEDNDCDGRVDEDFDVDMDGYSTCGTVPTTPGTPDPELVDCDDSDPDRRPGAPEICDGIDNDCDGTTDPGCACAVDTTQSCGSTVGTCRRGTQLCVVGVWGACTGAIGPVGMDACNGADEDCDGTIDEDAVCGAGEVCDEGLCIELNTPIPVDPDTDGDGIPDAIECPGGELLDSDGDGLPDCRDPDDDNDGILTIDERPGFIDRFTDRDDLPDHLDPDDDGDTVPTLDEHPGGPDRDTDGDGVVDRLDNDDDNDGILTATEIEDDTTPGDDFDGDGNPSYLDTDADGDGALDEEEGRDDVDGDGAPDYLDVDGSENVPDLSGFSGGACSATTGAPLGGLIGIAGVLLVLFRRKRR